MKATPKRSKPANRAGASKSKTPRATSTVFWRKPWVLTTAVILLFCVLGLFATWPILPGTSARVPGCACGDPFQSSWFLSWTTFAILHGHNPLFTHYLDLPVGANLAQNTVMPLLALLAAPLTTIAGPIASFNFLAWLAFPISALAMFYVAWRMTKSRLGALAAGLLYGFSPYIVGQGGVHIMLSFVPLPPLMTLAVWQLFVEQKGKSVPTGLLLGAEIIAQFLIDPEGVAITGIVIGIAFLLIVLFVRKLITKERLRFALPGVVAAMCLTIVILAYPIWFMALGPNHFRGPNFFASNPYRSDALGLIVPTLNEKIVPAGLVSFSHRTTGGDFPEAGDYIGIVLLVLLATAVIRWRRNKWITLTVLSAFICWILSLGPRLVVNGRITNIPMPFALFTRLPLLQDILPSRISLAEWLLVPLAVALGIMELQRERRARSVADSIHNPWLFRIGATIVAIAVVITLIPNWPYSTSRVNIPALFTKNSRSIPNNAIALTYPYPMFPNDQAMIWQAQSNMRFRLLGAYMQHPGPSGLESQFPDLQLPASVQEWLAYEQEPAVTPWPIRTSIDPGDITQFLQNNNVDIVMINPTEVNAKKVILAFQQALGAPQTRGGMIVWIIQKPLS